MFLKLHTENILSDIRTIFFFPFCPVTRTVLRSVLSEPAVGSDQHNVGAATLVPARGLTHSCRVTQLTQLVPKQCDTTCTFSSFSPVRRAIEVLEILTTHIFSSSFNAGHYIFLNTFRFQARPCYRADRPQAAILKVQLWKQLRI